MINTRQEGHGKIDSFLNKFNQNNKTYEEIVFSAITSTNGGGKNGSLLDLFNTKGLSKNNFSFLISNMLSKLEKKTGIILFDRNKNEFTKEGINYINILLNESLDYYNNYLLRNVGSSFVKKRSKNKGDKINLANTKEVRDFFTHSSIKKNQSATRQIHCSLLKTAYAINDIKINEDKMNKAEEEFGTIKQNLFFNHFYDHKFLEASESIKNNENNFRYIKLQTKCEKSTKRSIFFNCAGRVKRKEQILIKELSDPKYDSVDAIKDIYGIRNEVKTQEDALFLLEYMRIHVLDKSGEISHKNIFGETIEESQEFIRSYASKLNPEFYAKLYKSLEKMDREGGKINENYKDVKIRGNLGGHASEIQINLVDNKNETGYAHHLIFDAKKKIRALSRLQGYIPYSIIHRYIKEAIEKSILEAEKYGGNAELLSLGGYNGSIKGITEELKKKASDKIFNYLLNKEQNIIKLQIPDSNNKLNYYTSLSNWNYFHENKRYLSLYPDGAKAFNIKTNIRTDQTIAA